MNLLYFPSSTRARVVRSLRGGLRLALLCGLVFQLGACASFRKGRAPEAAREQKMIALGKVAMVNDALGFVLIQSAMGVETGALLQSRLTNGTETAQLRVSGEKRPPFLIADVMKGRPQVGNVVTVLVVNP